MRDAAERAAEEAARKYTAFRVWENGVGSFFRLGQKESLLDVGKFLRRYLLEGQESTASAFQAAFAGLEPVTAEQYSQLMEAHLEYPSKIAGVFELDFDKQEVSAVYFGKSWKTYSVKDISSAVYFAYRKSSLLPEQYEARFENRLTGRSHSSAGHLSARDISFADEISKIDTRLYFRYESLLHIAGAVEKDPLDPFQRSAAVQRFGPYMRPFAPDFIGNAYAPCASADQRSAG